MEFHKPVLLQLYFNSIGNVFLVGTELDIFYKQTDYTTYIDALTSSEQLGRVVWDMLTHSEKGVVDVNWYKKMPKIRTWSQFLGNMKLINIEWVPDDSITTTPFVRQKNGYIPDPIRSPVQLPGNTTKKEIGVVLTDLMNDIIKEYMIT